MSSTIGLSLKKLQNRKYAYIPLNSNSFKFEEKFMVQKDQEGNTYRQSTGFRIYINENIPWNYMKYDNFKVRIQKVKDDIDLSTRYYIQQESFDYIFKKFLGEILNAKETGDDKNIKKYITNFKEITQINSNNKNPNYFTCPNIILPQATSEEEQKSFQQINQFFSNPEPDFLLSLTNFSSIPIDFTFKVDGRKISYKEAKKKINEIFEDSKLDKKIIKKLKFAFNLDSYFKYNNRESSFWQMFKSSKDIIKEFKGKTKREIFLEEYTRSGGILHGPPGTGKTYSVRNTVFKIYKEVFGYEIVEIDMRTLTEGGSYYGALANAVTEVFKKAIKRVQQTQRPCLVFVDEADRLIRNTDRDDDQEGFASHKNYINPLSYPGIQLCYVTNIEDKGEMNTGLVERRLNPIFFDYPTFEVARNVWKHHIRTKFFPRNDIKIKFMYKGEVLDNKEVYDSLAKLVEGNVGLDRIEDFCKDYKNTKTDIEAPIENFKEFKLEFFKKTISRIETLKQEKLNKLTNVRQQLVDTSAIEKVKNMFEEQFSNLESALKIGSAENRLNSYEIRKSLTYDDNNNIFYKEYKKFFYRYFELIDLHFNQNFKLESEKCLGLFVEIYESSFLLNKYFKLGQNYFRKDLENMKQIIENLNKIFELSLDISSKYLAKHGNEDILLENPRLSINNLDIVIDSELDDFLVNVKNNLEYLLPTKIFNLKNINDKDEEKELEKEKKDTKRSNFLWSLKKIRDRKQNQGMKKLKKYYDIFLNLSNLYYYENFDKNNKEQFLKQYLNVIIEIEKLLKKYSHSENLNEIIGFQRGLISSELNNNYFENFDSFKSDMQSRFKMIDSFDKFKKFIIEEK